MSALAEAATGLRFTDYRYPWVGPTEDEANTAEVLDEFDTFHVEAGAWCGGCRQSWPCSDWVWAQQLAVQWLGRAADRVYAHARAVPTGSSSRRAA